MCGVFGKLFFKKTQIEPKKYQGCIECLYHRGPDDSSFYYDQDIILGARRLAIIDHSKNGRMPMCNEDRSKWIIFNGEIYNHQLLRESLSKKHHFKSKTDTEVILHLFEEKGYNCLKYLRGMFVFAIWDTKKKELFIARDRIGKKPLKFFLGKDFFIFASELKAILKDEHVPKEIDYASIDEYLTYRYMPSPKTGFRNIYKLEPATYLRIKLQTKEIIKKNYWNLDFSEKLSLNEEEWEIAILNKLKESTLLRLTSDIPVGIHLSGGIDSSLITAIAAEHSQKSIKTFSVGFKEKDFNELNYAKLVSKKYNTDHHEFIIEPNMIEAMTKFAYYYEEPYADSSALPSWFLSILTKKYVTVALNGDGGDENFGGYLRYNAYLFYQLIKKIPCRKSIEYFFNTIYNGTKIKPFRWGSKFFSSFDNNDAVTYLNFIRCYTESEKNLIYHDDFKKLIIPPHYLDYISSKFSETINLNFLDKLFYVDIHSYLPDDLLVKSDISGMSHSLEIRSPFLDHEFVELAAKMPANLKIKNLTNKYLLKKIASKYLPKILLKRKKQGFSVPIEDWFRSSLKTFVQEKLLDDKFLSYGFFKRKGLENLIYNHSHGIRNYADHIWALLSLQEWLNIWFGRKI